MRKKYIKAKRVTNTVFFSYKKTNSVVSFFVNNDYYNSYRIT